MSREDEQRLRDDLSLMNQLNDDLEQRVASLEMQLDAEKSLSKAHKLVADATFEKTWVPRADETHPMVEMVGKVKPASVFELGARAAFELAFGLPKAILLGGFVQGKLRECIKKNYPKMRRSAARAILMDNVCGKSLVEVPLHSRQRVGLIFDLLDLFETMVVDQKQAEAIASRK